jgi:hypothetical protein
MKRLTLLFAFVVVGTMLFTACTRTVPTSSGSGSGGAVQAGASGIKDAALLGKWVSADGGSSYDFKDDFNVTVQNVGSEFKSTYNILEGGNGSGKIEIGESGGGKTVWDYKITDVKIEFTTPEGRARKMTKTQ